MPVLSFGPLEFRTRTTGNWTEVDFAFVTDRTKSGWATRETAIRTGFKSEHLLELTGEEDPTDTVTIDGTTYCGRVAKGIDGQVHRLSAKHVATKAAYRKALKEAKAAAHRADQIAGGLDPIDIVVEPDAG